MNTVSNDQWAALCEQQHARAMAGDAAAATWCAKHQPEGATGGTRPATTLDELTDVEREKLSHFLLLRDADLAAFPSGLHAWPKIVAFCENLLAGTATAQDLKAFARAVASIGSFDNYARTAGKCPELSDVSRNEEINAGLERILARLDGEKTE